MPAVTDQDRLINEQTFEYLTTPGMEKRAIDALNDFTRTMMREDGFYRKTIPSQTITNSELDRVPWTDKPIKVVDMEPDSPAAISIPFATLPINLYIRGPRYQVDFDRIVTPRFTKDVDELRTWIMDIRQVLSDNAIKDMLAEEDAKFIDACNTAMVGADTVVPQSGSIQWKTIPGGVSRDSLEDAFKVMPKAYSRVEVNTVIVNNIFIREVMKIGRDEMGGDYSQDLFKNGWTDENFMKARWIITIKHDLVGDDTMFMFADPKFIGKSYELEPPTLYVKREAFMLEFFGYQTLGGSIGNTSGVARVDFS